MVKGGRKMTKREFIENAMLWLAFPVTLFGGMVIVVKVMGC